MVPIPSHQTQNSAPRPVQYTEEQYRVGENLSTHRGDNGYLNFTLQSIWNFN